MDKWKYARAIYYFSYQKLRPINLNYFPKGAFTKQVKYITEFYLGDLHAVMGDGKVSVCGAEVSGEVTVTVEIIKGRPYCLPIVFIKEVVYTIASDVSLDNAAVTATKNMGNILVSKGSLKLKLYLYSV